MDARDPFSWYREMPPVSRVYLTLAFGTTAACALEVLSPFSLYYNYNLIFQKGQFWRLVTNFWFFGLFSIDFVFHMYFLVRYCRLLEENSFRGRTADFVFFILFGASCLVAIAPFVHINFFGSSLSFMMVYLWGRRNEHVQMSFLGLLPFSAPYLPWVLLFFSVLLGNSYVVDVLGISVGHIYFYLQDVLPRICEIRGWRERRLLDAPLFVKAILGDDMPVVLNANDVADDVVQDANSGENDDFNNGDEEAHVAQHLSDQGDADAVEEQDVERDRGQRDGLRRRRVPGD